MYHKGYVPSISQFTPLEVEFTKKVYLVLIYIIKENFVQIFIFLDPIV